MSDEETVAGSKTTQKSDFTIEHILNRAGESKSDQVRRSGDGMVPVVAFPWLQCTRYCPPKIPSKFQRSIILNKQQTTVEQNCKDSK